MRKHGIQLFMCSLCIVELAKGSHALGGPCMDVSRALFCTESPRSTQQIHELFVQLGVETCRTTLPQSLRPVGTATSGIQSLRVYCSRTVRDSLLTVANCSAWICKGACPIGPSMDAGRCRGFDPLGFFCSTCLHLLPLTRSQTLTVCFSGSMKACAQALCHEGRRGQNLQKMQCRVSTASFCRLRRHQG